MPSSRTIAARTPGRRHGPITRLMNPGDIGHETSSGQADLVRQRSTLNVVGTRLVPELAAFEDGPLP
ncbi:hypothetical protein LBMAG30_06330 [Comamonadaceae bacterium]|nr:hypothetical protein LBMAG30_06330 [Comamonadaceae bacterium]